MKAFVRVYVGTYESVDAFKATELWSIIDEHNTLDIEVVQGSNKAIAVITSHDNDATFDTMTNSIESVIRPKIQEKVGLGNIDRRLTFTSQAELDSWKAGF